MGATQHTVGTANVRAFCIALLATGNVGGFGNGANIFRGHCNVQGATDLGLDIVTLPLYYGLAEGAWKHWCRVWEIDYDWMLSRFDSKQVMEAPGIPSTRWFDAAMLPKDQVKQKDNLKAMMVFGHGGNTVTRMPEAAKGLEKLELLVVADPHPTTWAVLGERKNGTYLLPICTQFECAGSRTASNRSIQWGEQVVKPIFESKNDYEVMYLLAKKLGFADRMFKNIKVENDAPVAEDILREINRGGWSTGYCGQSPERLKVHMANQKNFDLVTLRAKDGPAKGDYYGLPWPCWGTPELKHPGTHTLYNTNLHVMDGGGTFRARFGVEREVKLPDGTIAQGQPAGRRLLLARLGDQGRLSRVHLWGAQEARLGQGPHRRREWRSSSASAATTRTPSPGRPTSRAASSASRWSTAASTTATARRAPMRGTCPTRSRCTASRSTRRAPIWSPSIRPCRTRCSSACPMSASTCRRPRSTRASPSSSR